MNPRTRPRSTRQGTGSAPGRRGGGEQRVVALGDRVEKLQLARAGGHAGEPGDHRLAHPHRRGERRVDQLRGVRHLPGLPVVATAQALEQAGHLGAGAPLVERRARAERVERDLLITSWRKLPEARPRASSAGSTATPGSGTGSSAAGSAASTGAGRSRRAGA